MAEEKTSVAYSENTMVAKILQSANLSPPPAIAEALNRAAPVLGIARKVVDALGPLCKSSDI